MSTAPAIGGAPPGPQPASPEPFFYAGGRTGVLLIHGWSGSPAEMRGMGAYLAGQGLTTSGIRLPGHGTQPADLFATRWQDWAAAAGQGLHDLRRHCDTVFVGGLSMGALLSLYLGATARPPIAGVIAMGAPIYFADPRIAVLPFMKYLIRWHTKGPSDLIDATARERLWHYPRVPTHSIHQMSLIGREARRLLPQLRVPLLIMQGRHDKAIPPGCGEYLYAQAASPDKTLVVYEHSGHGITEDAEREAVWARAATFIQEHTPPHSPPA
ncbi:MAG TPA: alpha/beta fold hydrolase [Chloroflexia bacterium]|nr:alpha/beta fold hydrolase [Chloroflexia bacterium]